MSTPIAGKKGPHFQISVTGGIVSVDWWCVAAYWICVPAG